MNNEFWKLYHESPTLLDWTRGHIVEDRMHWKGAAEDQFFFYRDALAYRICKNPEQDCRVVSTHRSKSIVLPVVAYETKWGWVISRHNFYNFMCTVSLHLGKGFTAPVPLPINDYMAGDKQTVNPVYCEGFDPSWVYSRYQPGCNTFTSEFANKYDLYTALYTINQWGTNS